MGDSKVATEGVSDPLLFIEPAEEKRLLRKVSYNVPPSTLSAPVQR